MQGPRREAPADAFGRTAREYELGRPGWPEELLGRVVGAIGLGPDAEVLDPPELMKETRALAETALGRYAG